LEAVFFIQRVEMTSGARKVGAFTFSNCMNMNRMEPLRKPRDVYCDQHAILSLSNRGGANAFPLRVFDIGAGPVLGGGIYAIA